MSLQHRPMEKILEPVPEAERTGFELEKLGGRGGTTFLPSCRTTTIALIGKTGILKLRHFCAKTVGEVLRYHERYLEPASWSEPIVERKERSQR